MKKIINIISIIIIIVASSCEKIIDLNLNEAEPRIVVEGQVTNNTTIGSFVKLSTTKKVQANNTVIPVTDAAVSIQENNGSFVALPEVQPGVYENKTLVGITNRTYSLKIQYAGQTITASSKMPLQVNLDSLIIEDFPQFGRTVKVVTPFYNDPLGLGNHYNFKMYRNTKLIKDPFAYDDLFLDGKRISFPLIYSREEDEFKKDDIIDIEMLCIDEANYKYWFSLSQSATGNPQSAPNNPISNLIGNAIGVFSANTYQKKSVKVK